MHSIDMRSDTVTQPTQAMRDAMHRAVVGDDVFDDDPTVKELEAYAARLFDKEAALFVTSGTQGNACAVMAQTRRGDCIVIAPGSHISDHEAGSYALLSGVSVRYAQAKNGTMSPEAVRACITDDSDLQIARTGLIVVENAHSSGAVAPPENMAALHALAREHGVPLHLDGARLFNAAAALKLTDPRALTRHCDTVMCCLSKGLCAPVGSVLAGPADVIHRAKKARKLLGGGLRQAGFLAAAGIIALRDMPGRIADDHANAKYLAALLGEIKGLHVFQERAQIDMVFFAAAWSAEKSARYPAFMAEHGVKVTGLLDGEFRLVTHRDVEKTDCDTVAALIRSFAAEK